MRSEETIRCLLARKYDWDNGGSCPQTLVLKWREELFQFAATSAASSGRTYELQQEF